MSDFLFSTLRFAYLGLLWLLIFLMLRALARGTAEATSVSHAPVRRPGAKGLTGQGRRKGATTIYISEGRLAGTSMPLSPVSITIGRAVDNTLVLDDNYTSSHHARIYPQASSWWVEDLGSTNGTIVQGRAIDRPVRLDLHVPVSIGKTTLELR